MPPLKLSPMEKWILYRMENEINTCEYYSSRDISVVFARQEYPYSISAKDIIKDKQLPPALLAGLKGHKDIEKAFFRLADKGLIGNTFDDKFAGTPEGTFFFKKHVVSGMVDLLQNKEALNAFLKELEKQGMSKEIREELKKAAKQMMRISKEEAMNIAFKLIMRGTQYGLLFLNLLPK